MVRRDVQRESATGTESVKRLPYHLQKRILEETEQMPANPKIEMESYKSKMPCFYHAVKTVLSAERRIEAPGNLWNVSQRRAFEE